MIVPQGGISVIRNWNRPHVNLRTFFFDYPTKKNFYLQMSHTLHTRCYTFRKASFTLPFCAVFRVSTLRSKEMWISLNHTSRKYQEVSDWWRYKMDKPIAVRDAVSSLVSNCVDFEALTIQNLRNVKSVTCLCIKSACYFKFHRLLINKKKSEDAVSSNFDLHLHPLWNNHL